MDVVVAGQGYVGLPLAVRAAEVGHRVVGYDVNPDRIKRLTAGDSYVEDVASSRLRAVLDTGAYSATADADALAGFDIAVITVPTPLRDGVPDLTYIESCARTLGGRLRPGATVVLESTTYPGTTEELLVPILEKASGLKAGVDFLAGFSPERIAPGNNKRWSFDGTPKVVSGIDGRSLDAIKGFYDGIFQTTVPVSGPKVAEMAKLIENVFRFVNISLVNEMATLAAPLGSIAACREVLSTTARATGRGVQATVAPPANRGRSVGRLPSQQRCRTRSRGRQRLCPGPVRHRSHPMCSGDRTGTARPGRGRTTTPGPFPVSIACHRHSRTRGTGPGLPLRPAAWCPQVFWAGDRRTR